MFEILVLTFSLAFADIGDTLVVAIPNRVVTLNPADTVVAQDRFVLPLLFEYLVEADPYGEIVNRLISSWEFDKAKGRLKLSLVKGRKFSDGSPLTADDVLFAFTKLCAPGSKAASQFIGLKGCGEHGALGVTKLDADNIQLDISIHPNAFLYQLAYGRAPIFKLDKGGQPIGTGPFALQKMVDGNCDLIRNVHSPRVSEFGKIEVRYVGEDQIAGMVKARSFQVASMYLRPTLETFKSDDYSAAFQNANVTQVLVMNPKRGPFKDRAFRQAFRDRLHVSGVDKCKNVTPVTGYVPRGVPGSLEEWPATKKDAFKKAADVSVVFYQHVGRRDDCEAKIIREVGASLGLRIEFKYLSDYKELLKKYMDPTTDGYVELNPFVTRDPSAILRRFIPNSPDGYYFYGQDRIREQLNEALQKPTITERARIYRTINREIVDYAAVVPLYYVAHTVLIDRCLKLKTIDLGTYNPNSFLYLLDLEKNGACRRLRQ